MAERQRMLVLVAHPDDESFWGGGTIAYYGNQGVDITVGFLTNGDKGSHKQKDPISGRIEDLPKNDLKAFVEKRKNECLQASKHLGSNKNVFFDFPDQGLNHEAIPHIKKLIASSDPHIILSLSEAGTTLHPDHTSTGIDTFLAIESLIWETYQGEIHPKQLPFTPPFSFRKYFTFLLPSCSDYLDRYCEIVAPDQDLTHIDVSSVINQKKAAASSHQSQSHLVDHLYRAGFFDCPTESYLERISIGQSARGQDDLFYGLDNPNLTLRISEFPAQPDKYRSTSNEFFDDLQQKIQQAENAIPHRMLIPAY